MATMRKEDIKTEWEKPKETPFADLSNEQIQSILKYRSNLFNDVATHYKEFVQAIYKLPIHVVYRQNAFLNVDQGFHWVEKGINNVWDIPEETDTIPSPENNS